MGARRATKFACRAGVIIFSTLVADVFRQILAAIILYALQNNMANGPLLTVKQTWNAQYVWNMVFIISIANVSIEYLLTGYELRTDPEVACRSTSGQERRRRQNATRGGRWWGCVEAWRKEPTRRGPSIVRRRGGVKAPGGGTTCQHKSVSTVYWQIKGSLS